jgi:hypothetical protein
MVAKHELDIAKHTNDRQFIYLEIGLWILLLEEQPDVPFSPSPW